MIHGMEVGIVRTGLTGIIPMGVSAGEAFTQAGMIRGITVGIALGTTEDGVITADFTAAAIMATIRAAITDTIPTTTRGDGQAHLAAGADGVRIIVHRPSADGVPLRHGAHPPVQVPVKEPHRAVRQEEVPR